MTTLHVMPRDDLVEHEADDACVCVPRAETVQEDDGSTGWVMVHHALDGREGRVA